MVLVDTSIWIRYLYGREEFRAGVDALTSDEEACGHDLIFGELLIGDHGGRQLFLTSYSLMRQLPTIAHDEVVLLVRHRQLHGRGISWIDAHLLASALASHVQLWTADTSLAAIASELGIAYRP